MPKAVSSTQTSTGDDTLFSPKQSSSVNVSSTSLHATPEQKAAHDSAILDSIIDEDYEDELKNLSEPSNQVNDFNAANPPNQFFNSSIYDNVPSLNNTQYGPDMSLALNQFIDNIRRQSGAHDINLNNLSVRGLDDSSKDYAIVYNKETNEVLTVDKPEISATGLSKSGEAKKPSPKRTRSGKVRLSNPPSRKAPKNDQPSTSGASSSGDFMKKWTNYEKSVREKFK